MHPIARKLLVLGLLFSPLLSAQTEEIIGTLQDVEGTVLLKQGEESIPAFEGQQVRASQEILITEGARAVLVFNDGCDIMLDPEELYRVPSRSPCFTLTWAAPAAAAALCAGAHASDDKNSRNVAVAALVVGAGLMTAAHNRENDYREFLAALEAAQGEVMVTDESGVVTRIQPGTRLKAGQRVSVSDGAKALIRFDDGCSRELEVDANRTQGYTIPHNSPCFRNGLWWASAAAATALCVTVEDPDDTSSP